jgi:hypothetical protein
MVPPLAARAAKPADHGAVAVAGSCLGSYHTDRQPSARHRTTRCPLPRG